MANCSTQTHGDVTVIKENELKKKLHSSIFHATMIQDNDSCAHRPVYRSFAFSSLGQRGKLYIKTCHLIFKSVYWNCCCIIDHSEIFIEMLASFSAHSKTYSDYVLIPDWNNTMWKYFLSHKVLGWSSVR